MTFQELSGTQVFLDQSGNVFVYIACYCIITLFPGSSKDTQVAAPSSLQNNFECANSADYLQ